MEKKKHPPLLSSLAPPRHRPQRPQPPAHGLAIGIDQQHDLWLGIVPGGIGPDADFRHRADRRQHRRLGEHFRVRADGDFHILRPQAVLDQRPHGHADDPLRRGEQAVQRVVRRGDATARDGGLAEGVHPGHPAVPAYGDLRARQAVRDLAPHEVVEAFEALGREPDVLGRRRDEVSVQHDPLPSSRRPSPHR